MRIKGADGHEYDVTGQGQGAFNTAGGIAGILALLGFDLNTILGNGWNKNMSPEALISALNGSRNSSNNGIIEAILSVVMSLLASNMNGGIRTNCGCSENTPVSRFDLTQSEKMTALQNENALLKANIFTDQKMSEFHKELSGRISVVEARQNEINMTQAVYNGTNNAALECLKAQIAALQGLTEVVVPQRKVCETGRDCN